MDPYGVDCRWEPRRINEPLASDLAGAMAPRRISFRVVILVGLVVLGALSRLLPHPPNATPVLAFALFGGAYFTSSRWAFGVPFFAMLISDIALNLTQGAAMLTPVQAAVYGSIGAVVGVGIWLRSNVSVLRVAVGGFAGAVLFFLVTNFAVWLGGSLYPYTFSGLVECYAAALPFFRNTLLSTWGYGALLFGIFEGMKVQFPRLAVSAAEA